MGLGDLIAEYGNRADGSKKGNGYFGALYRPDGDISTELSFDFDHGGRNISAPLLVPTLDRSEIEHLLAGGRPTDAIYQKAQDFALKRMLLGRPTFARPNEVFRLPSGALEDVIAR